MKSITKEKYVTYDDRQVTNIYFNIEFGNVLVVLGNYPITTDLLFSVDEFLTTKFCKWIPSICI